MRYAILLLTCLLAGCFGDDQQGKCDEPLQLPSLY